MLLTVYYWYVMRGNLSVGAGAGQVDPRETAGCGRKPDLIPEDPPRPIRKGRKQK